MIDQLRKLIGSDKVTDHPTTLESVAIDESALTPVTPRALVWAETAADIETVVKFAYEEEIPLTARGAGSALEGSTIPLAEGIVLDFSRMKRVLEFWPEDLQVRVEPGVVYDQLNEFLKRESLFFPPAPGGSSDVATIGGMVSTNASGIYSVKYGCTKDYVLQLEVVDGTGRLHRFGNRAVKRSSGYNLIDLVVGSEGTLALITAVTLRLQGIPEGNRRIAFKFKSETDAAAAVSEMMRYGLDLAAVEYLDRDVIAALNLLNDYGLEETASLFLEIHGPAPVLDANQQVVAEIVTDQGGEPLTLTSGQNPWEIRHHVTDAIKLRRPGYSIIRNDVAFPISKLPEMVEYCRLLARESGLLVHTFGHVGIGLLHALTLARRQNKVEWQLGGEINRKIIARAVALGGTISGEHGIGLGHKEMFQREQEQSLELMRSIKQVLDPRGILNPGKIIDPA
ncbi:MAG: FAD-binding oxidoreductase [candidate division Zixibacteria bacterium]|nr:FAD-binding oxidoreductase [candidate division Zixibacteria bacterium]